MINLSHQETQLKFLIMNKFSIQPQIYTETDLYLLSFSVEY